jgi:ribosomal protein S18 acetylase RimI-like enzyme
MGMPGTSPLASVRPPAGPEELELVRTLFREYQAELRLEPCFEGFAQELSGLPGDYAPPAGRILLAWDQHRLAGCVALRKVDGETAEMKRLFIRPAFRRGGWGRRLTMALLEEARRLGYRRIRLDTLPVMEAARALYAELGFRPIEPYREVGVPGAIFLGKELSA